MSNYSAGRAGTGAEMVFKPSQAKIALTVAVPGLYLAAFIIIILQRGPEPLAMILIMFQFSLLVLLYLILRRNEVRLSGRALKVQTIWGKRVIASRDLRYVRMGWGRILKVAYEDQGRIRHVKVRFGLMSFSDEHRLINAIQEFWPGLLLD